MPYPGQKPDQEVPAAAVSRAFSMKQIISDVTSPDPEAKNIAVKYSVADASSKARASVLAAASVTIRADVTFSGYRAGNGAVLYGDMVIFFEGTLADTSVTITRYSAETEGDVRITYDNVTSSVSVSELQGTIESAAATVNEGAEPVIAQITSGKVSADISGSFVIGSEEVSKAEADGLVSGGDGKTPETAYVISTAAQFLNISSICADRMEEITYFRLGDDIEIGANDYIDMFSGVLDGDNHSIAITDEAEDAPPFVVRATGKYAEFRNFDFHTRGGKAIVYGDELVDDSGSIILDTEYIGFENVDVYGVAEDVGTNMGFYLVYGEADEIMFSSCTNNASMYGSMNAYSAPFLGYLVGGSSGMQTSRLTFKDCTNNGDFIMGKAGFLVANGGNSGNYVSRYILGEGGTPAEGGIQLVVSGMKNSGKFVGYDGNAGWFTWNDTDPQGAAWTPVNEYVEDNVTELPGSRLDTTGVDGLVLTAAEDENSNVVLHASINGAELPDTYLAVYQRSFYGSYRKPDGSSAGTLRTVDDIADPANAGSKTVTIDDLHEFVANGQVMEPVAPAGNACWQYSVTLYDPATGYPVGGAKASSVN